VFKIETLILVLTLILMMVPSSQAQAVSVSEDFKKTQAYWQQQINADPLKPLNYFNMGVVLQQNKKYSEAITSYDKAIELHSPLAPVALFYKARAYEALGQVPEAQKTISTINMATIPPALKTRVLEYKNKLFADEVATDQVSVSMAAADTPQVSQTEEKDLSVYLEVMRGSNSNPDIYADTQSSSIQADAQTQFRASFDYLAWVSGFHDFRLSYSYSATQFDKTTSSNYASHDVMLPISFYFGNSRLKINPELIKDTYSGSDFSESKGAELAYTYKLKDSYLNLSVQAMTIDNKTTSYSYLTGNMQKYSLSYENRWSNSKLISSFYGSQYKYQDSATLASSYAAYGGGLSYVYYNGDFDLSTSLSLEGRQYKKASANTSARTDLKAAVNAQLGYVLGANIRLFLDANYTKNKSNFDTTTDDRNYTQSIYSIGLNWSY
jgi:hypothetical protein